VRLAYGRAVLIRALRIGVAVMLRAGRGRTVPLPRPPQPWPGSIPSILTHCRPVYGQSTSSSAEGVSTLLAMREDAAVALHLVVWGTQGGR
jgi:hypothetical protein